MILIYQYACYSVGLELCHEFAAYGVMVILANENSFLTAKLDFVMVMQASENLVLTVSCIIY